MADEQTFDNISKFSMKRHCYTEKNTKERKKKEREREKLFYRWLRFSLLNLRLVCYPAKSLLFFLSCMNVYYAQRNGDAMSKLALTKKKIAKTHCFFKISRGKITFFFFFRLERTSFKLSWRNDRGVMIFPAWFNTLYAFDNSTIHRSSPWTTEMSRIGTVASRFLLTNIWHAREFLVGFARPWHRVLDPGTAGNPYTKTHTDHKRASIDEQILVTIGSKPRFKCTRWSFSPLRRFITSCET